MTNSIPIYAGTLVRQPPEVQLNALVTITREQSLTESTLNLWNRLKHFIGHANSEPMVDDDGVTWTPRSLVYIGADLSEGMIVHKLLRIDALHQATEIVL